MGGYSDNLSRVAGQIGLMQAMAPRLFFWQRNQKSIVSMSSENRSDDLFQSFREGFEGISKKVSSFVDDVFTGEGPAGEVRPRMDVFETEEAYVVELELTGVQKKDVKIQVQDSILHIRGQKMPPTDVADRVYLNRERRFGAFTKSIHLPEGVELENIKAKFEHGLLSVRFPFKTVNPKTTGDDINID